MMNPKPPHRERRIRTKQPKQPDTSDPKRWKGLPPGFRMRLCKYARLLSKADVDRHNEIDRDNVYLNRFIEVDPQNSPIKADPSSSDAWPTYRLVKRGKLECSGLIFIFDSQGKFLKAEPPIVSEGYYSDETKRPTLKKALDALVAANPAGDKCYVVARYRMEPKFAVHYWNRFWDPAKVREHLEFALKGKPPKITGFVKRLTDSTAAGKYYWIRNPGGMG